MLKRKALENLFIEYLGGGGGGAKVTKIRRGALIFHVESKTRPRPPKLIYVENGRSLSEDDDEVIKKVRFVMTPITNGPLSIRR